MMPPWLGFGIIAFQFVLGCIFLVVYIGDFASQGRAKTVLTVFIVLGGLFALADGLYTLHLAGFFYFTAYRSNSNIRQRPISALMGSYLAASFG
jgi:hypothetical protein